MPVLKPTALLNKTNGPIRDRNMSSYKVIKIMTHTLLCLTVLYVYYKTNYICLKMHGMNSFKIKVFTYVLCKFSSHYIKCNTPHSLSTKKHDISERIAGVFS